jgi:hypothetical protein
MNIYKNLSLGFVVILFSACETEQECKGADLLIFNTEIYTANEQQAKAEALAILDGKFIFIGSNKDSLPYQCGTTEILNLENSFVYPGFIDAHAHLKGIGGGVGLALSGDLIVASESAKFKLVFGPNLGIIPDVGASWFVPNLVGRARANGMGLLGDDISAKQAKEWGLIWDYYPDRAKPTPPPAAIPFIAVITGLSIEVINLINGLKPISILFAPISPPVIPSSLGQPPFARSAPEQNPLPSPVITITLESFSLSISWKIS